MESKNDFYVAKLNERVQVVAGYSWASGSWEPVDNYKMASSDLIDIQGVFRLISTDDVNKNATIKVRFFDKDSIAVSPLITVAGGKKAFDIALNRSSAIKYMIIEVYLNETFTMPDYGITKLYGVTPYYKNLSKQYKKEDGQLFFRESINGKINLYGFGYNFVKNASLEDTFAFYIYRGNTQIAVNEFNKTDCKLDYRKGSIELKLTPKDKYINVLNSYDKTYDLIKLAIEKSIVTLTKRCVVQIYIQGEKTITNYAGGAYWEEEVSESVDNSNSLLTKYYFSKGPTFKEISLSGFNYDNLNTVFKCIEGNNIWNSTGFKIINGVRYEFNCSIKFTKIYNKNQLVSDRDLPNDLFLLSSPNTVGYKSQYGAFALYDSYRIEIYDGLNGTGSKLYESENIYGNDSNFILTSGSYYLMKSVAQQSPNKQPTPSSFYLGPNVLEYQVWGRVLCDVDKDSDGQVLYDLPYDDFATERGNFKKCKGLNFVQNENSLVRFKQSNETSQAPTPYGLTEYGEYFKKPSIYGTYRELYAYPLAKSSWGNTSVWVAFEEENIEGYGLENMLKKYHKDIKHKDCMELGAVIKALLKEIDSDLKFESTEEYSRFFYDQNLPGGYSAQGLQVYITQKSNVLKGEYDQAAQKAEITFKQLMEMLQNCFRCFWYIDNNRFRIEHVRYFMNGFSYSSPEIQFDLTNTHDRFNKKVVLYDQQKISYSKSDLNSRYEFSWADDAVSESMGGSFSVDIKSKYVQQDKKDTVNIDSFSSDIDLMMFAPDKFSEDGFALIITKNNKVPIVYSESYNQQDTSAPMVAYVQNYYASFIKLFENYLYDMPSANFSTSVDKNQNASERYNAHGLKRFTEHEIEFIPDSDIDVYKLVKTEIGDGYIEEASIDIDTGKVKTTLTY